MNIFKILSSGDGSIKEPNISSFLGYLLDPNKEHGLKDFLLVSLLRKLILNNDKLKFLQINDSDIVNLTNESKFTVNIELEKKVKIQSNKDRYIDIVVYIRKDGKLVFITCIENKIRDTSVTTNQLNEQFFGITNEYSEIPVGFIYLTPYFSEKCKEEYELFCMNHKEIPSYHLSWNDKEDESIYSLLVGMLENESRGLIEPIFEYSKYTIKAFLNFITTDFQSYREEKNNINKKLNYGKPIREYIYEIYENIAPNNEINIKDLKQKISSLVYKESGFELNKGTLSAQVYMSIVNEKNRIHYNVNEKNHEKFDLFYYVDDTKDTVKKFDSNSNIEIIYKN
jgi:hypothetical protein